MGRNAYRVGDVVWALATDVRGSQKQRPLIVIAIEPSLARRLICVCVTSSPPRREFDRFVALPWTDSGPSTTGLTQPSWAALDWLVELDAADVQRRIGKVSARLLSVIVDGVENG